MSQQEDGKSWKGSDKANLEAEPGDILKQVNIDSLAKEISPVKKTPEHAKEQSETQFSVANLQLQKEQLLTESIFFQQQMERLKDDNKQLADKNKRFEEMQQLKNDLEKLLFEKELELQQTKQALMDDNKTLNLEIARLIHENQNLKSELKNSGDAQNMQNLIQKLNEQLQKQIFDNEQLVSQMKSMNGLCTRQQNQIMDLEFKI